MIPEITAENLARAHQGNPLILRPGDFLARRNRNQTVLVLDCRRAADCGYDHVDEKEKCWRIADVWNLGI
jgi:hypothetical protein